MLTIKWINSLYVHVCPCIHLQIINCAVSHLLGINIHFAFSKSSQAVKYFKTWNQPVFLTSSRTGRWCRGRWWRPAATASRWCSRRAEGGWGCRRWITSGKGFRQCVCTPHPPALWLRGKKVPHIKKKKKKKRKEGRKEGRKEAFLEFFCMSPEVKCCSYSAHILPPSLLSLRTRTASWKPEETRSLEPRPPGFLRSRSIGWTSGSSFSCQTWRRNKQVRQS